MKSSLLPDGLSGDNNMKKLWMASILLLALCNPAFAQERFNGYSTFVVTTWATQCASALTPVMMSTFGYPPILAQQYAAFACACTIDHWREAMPYKQAMALSKEDRRAKSEQYTLMCSQRTEEL